MSGAYPAHTESEYLLWIETSIQRGLDAGLSHFSELVERLSGASPLDVLAALNSPPFRRDARAIAFRDEAARPISRTASSYGQGLPLPHPLDAEWRFTEGTAHTLLELLLSATSLGDSVLLLGTPTVALAALELPNDRHFHVVGDGNVVSSALWQLARGDPRMSRKATQEGAMAAVVDPPWYMRAYEAMLTSVSLLCRPSALVLVSVPPVGTRPGVIEERQDLIQLAASKGLIHVDERPRALNYQTPLFERAAFEAAGIKAALPNWRWGDLLSFKKQGPCEYKRPMRRQAFEVTLGGIRLRLLLTKGATDATLVPIHSKEVFPSISARAPGRARANLWTTTNRAFEIQPYVALWALARLASEQGVVLPPGLSLAKSRPESQEHVDAVSALTQEFGSLVGREKADAVRLAGESSWLQTVSDARFLNGSSRAFLGKAAAITG